MGRTKGAVAKDQVRITDRVLLSGVVSALVDRGVEGHSGLRAVARITGLPASRLTDWRSGRRSGLSRGHFATLFYWVNVLCAGDLAADFGSGALLSSVGQPEDGLGLWPAPTPHRPPRPREPEFLEAVFGQADAARIERGLPPSPASPVWDRWPVNRPLLATPKQYDMLRVHLHPPPGFEAAADGTPAVVETGNGPRVTLYFSYPAESPHRPSQSARRRSR